MTEPTPLQEKLAAMKAGNSDPSAKSGNSEENQQIPAPMLKQKQDSQEDSDPTSEMEVDPTTDPIPAPIVEVIPEKSYHVFYNTMNSVKMITETGRTIAFVGGKYITDVQEEIDYLNKQLSLGSVHLSTRPGQEVMTARDLDPMTAIRKQHMLEFKELQAEAARKIAAGEPLSQSESEVTPLTPGSTDHIAQLASDSGL